MLNVSIVCVGNLKEKYWTQACAEYSKRLGAFCRFSIVEVAEEKLRDDTSPSAIARTIEKEGERLLAAAPKGAKLLALCIEGKQRSSEELAAELADLAVGGCSSIAFLIGGSWGLSDKVKQAAAVRISMSRMTFPHQLARVMLCEQLYRAFMINGGGKYHK